jgi:hypothetical protein
LDFLAFLVLLGMVALVVGLPWMLRRTRVEVRSIPAYETLSTAMERAVEAGERVHMSLGVGNLLGAESATALAGISTFSKVAEATAIGDKPPVMTAGDGVLALLASDNLQTAYARAGYAHRYDTSSARMLGPTPLSYVGALPSILGGEHVSLHILSGSFGAEAGLAADMGERARATVIAGTEDVRAQALFYATADYPLLGEEVFAGGAYMGMKGTHRSSLIAQDVLRILIVVVVIVGSLVSLVGSLL